MKKVFLLTIIFLIVFYSCRKNQDTITNLTTNECYDSSDSVYLFDSDSGIFEYDLFPTLSCKPFKVHFYIPNYVNRTTAPVLFVFPGANRNADDYLNTWVSIADNKGLMVFSFEFDEIHYPGGNAYQQGYVLDDNGDLNDEDFWSFSAIDPVFDLIKSQLNYQLNYYDMFGHSAGAQFVHRYVLFKPNARINRAVAANSGWYTVPDISVLFPYGLGNSSLSINQIQPAFNHHLEIHLGQNDNDPNDPYLRTTTEANLQGAHRLERGRYFIDKCDLLSNEYNSSSFNWVKKEVPNVGHNQVKMANYAAEELY